MIAKSIPKSADVADSFRALAEYIAEAKDEGEKLEAFWIGNCDAGTELEDLPVAIAEVEATRAFKPDVPNKTYHLMVSFPTGEKPSSAEMKEIEAAFTKALGYNDHQYVAGTHINTDNFHLHVAYNKVHPKTLKIHTPWHDYKALEKTCRAMEQRYGLQVDLGMSDYEGEHRDKASVKAADFEAHTWQQSFQSYVLENKAEIRVIIDRAKGWDDVHKGLAELDMELVPRANGLVFRRPNGKEAVKASLVDRQFSKPALEKRFGPYEAQKSTRKGTARRRYTAKPLTRHPASGRLFAALMGSRRRRPQTVVGWAIKNWKTLLLTQAIIDPEALMIIIMHKQMFEALLGPSTGGPPTRLPKSCIPAVRRWMDAGAWGNGKTNAWLKANKVRGFGLKQDDEGTLMVPFRDVDGNLWGLQCLKLDGRTLAIGNLAKPGLMHVIDSNGVLDARETRIVATDDYATAAAVHSATQRPVVLVPPGVAPEPAIKCLKEARPNLEVDKIGRLSTTRLAEVRGALARAKARKRRQNRKESMATDCI